MKQLSKNNKIKDASHPTMIEIDQTIKTFECKIKENGHCNTTVIEIDTTLVRVIGHHFQKDEITSNNNLAFHSSSEIGKIGRLRKQLLTFNLHHFCKEINIRAKFDLFKKYKFKANCHLFTCSCTWPSPCLQLKWTTQRT